ncbi:MAG TPA: 16S rRNA (guanine(527)-N(7))-methyltransferase RsmG [Bacilli bacterium]|nr:16S rRNA (guanine(527)-N(7))-methyltransferase RsmG [Bacilli bacterium]
MTENNFIEELKKINIDINELQLQQLNRYYELLVEWNEKINLTAIIEKKDVYLKHFYDSLTITKIIDLNKEENLCDVGTGAGFPGIVLKILFPNLKVTLIDALDKRIKFLNIIIEELDLKNIETIHARSEEYGVKNREMYDVVTARAVANLPVLLEYCVPLVKKEKYFIPLKANISQEIINSQNAIKELSVVEENRIEFLLPIEESQRCIIKFKKISNTNKKYPRKNAEIKKKPL